MSTCRYAVAAHHSDDLVDVFIGKTLPVTLCGFHATDAWRRDALKWIGDNEDWLTRSAVDLMAGGSTYDVDNRRNALLLRVTKGTPEYAYTLAVIRAKRRSWLATRTAWQSEARRKPRHLHSAIRYYRTAQPTTPITSIIRMAEELLAHREESIRCTR